MEISFYNQWVTNGSKYADAVVLYNKFGKNETLKKLFNSVETIYTRTKIAFELKTIAIVTADEKQFEIPEGFKLFRESKKRIDPSSFPDSLKKDYYDLGPLIGRIRFLHSRLDIIQNESIRGNHALEILESVERRREIFNKIDYFNEHGKEMPKLQTPVAEEKQIATAEQESGELKLLRLGKELNLLRSQRSKLVKQPHRQAKLNDVIARVNEIKKEMDDVVI